MLTNLLTRWAHFVYRHPWLIVLVSLSIAGGGGYFTTHLGIKSDFAALLPENAQSVIDLREISDRMGAMGTLIVQVEGDDLKAMQRFADDIAASLRAYPKETIRFVDYKIDRQKAFFEHNKFLYPSIDELAELRDEMNDRLAQEKLKATGMYINLEDDDEDAKEEFDFRKKRDEYNDKLNYFDKFIDGYLTDKEGKTLIIVIKTPGTETGVGHAKRMVELVKMEVDKLDPKSYHPSLNVFFTGNMQTLVEEYYSLRDDILIISNVLVGMVLLAVALYYRSIRITAILCIGLLSALMTTFGITYLKIGYLTASTAFLASIVAGNGINFGIYFLARYMEERRSGRPVPDNLARTLTGTVRSVSTAAAAAGASYLSLMLTDFRGFSHFGFIGGSGMAICLIFALTLDPALTVLMERYLPFKETKDKGEKGRIFSHAAAWLVEHSPKRLFGVGFFLTVASIIALVLFLRDPYEYDFSKLRNQFSAEEGSGRRSTSSEDILGERSSPHVILADSMEQVPLIKKALEPYLATAPGPENGYIKNIKTIHDYLPGTEKEQKMKLKLLKDIRRTITKNDFDFLSEEDQQMIKDLTPPADLKQVRMDDLPDEILRRYIEEDGRRGTQVYVYMNDGMSVWNGRDLQLFASVVREIKLTEDKSIRSSGHAVIFSDMLHFVATDGPRATLLAFFFVLSVVVVSFRKFKHFAILGLSMSVGVILMMGFAIIFGQKINFLNYIAIPIQFGIGVDYSVNLYSRYLEEGPGSLGRVLRSTGGAVMITSLTTIIGYGALWFSLNGAINTFGTLANIGEVTCLATAVLFLPAYLALFRGGLQKPEDTSVQKKDEMSR